MIFFQHLPSTLPTVSLQELVVVPRLYRNCPRRQHVHNQQIRAAAASSDNSSVGTRFGFQLNERYLEWTDSAARQLIRIYVAQKLDKTLPEVEEMLSEISVLLPDINEKLDRLSADLVLKLVSDTDALAKRLVDLKNILPETNVSEIVVSNPWLFTSPSIDELQERMTALEKALPNIRIGKLVESEPRLLMVDIEAVLEEIRRLIPTADPVQVLLADPSMVLSMRQAGLPSSLTVDEGIDAN